MLEPSSDRSGIRVPVSVTPEVPPIPLPEQLARERGAILQRALRDLPPSLLEAMLRGLRRHSDALAPGGLYTGDGSGGCAVGMMLREITGEPSEERSGRWWLRFRFQSPTIREDRPDLARANPRLWHLELIFDVTCDEMGDRLGVPAHEVARSVGLWMAGETQAELSLRRMEAAAGGQAAARTLPAAELDARLFQDTVARLRQLRPWLSERQASLMVEGWVGARRAEPDPLYVPDHWATEVRLQRDRLEAVGAGR